MFTNEEKTALKAANMVYGEERIKWQTKKITFCA